MDTTSRGVESSTEAAEASPQSAHACRVISSGPIRCHLQASALVVPPFRLQHLRQSYLSRTEIRIDLRSVAPGRYRIVAVHNFHAEDRNPRLDECVAGVFLAAFRDDGRWEEPERFPVECRALAVLGELAIPMSVPPEVTA
jgi:hypothetical protein